MKTVMTKTVSKKSMKGLKGFFSGMMILVGIMAASMSMAGGQAVNNTDDIVNKAGEVINSNGLAAPVGLFDAAVPGHDTVWLDTLWLTFTDTLHDTVHTEVKIEVHDTTVVHDTITRKTEIEVHDTTWVHDTVLRTYDTIVYDTTWVHDTLYSITNIDTIIEDTFYWDTTVVDTVWIDTTIYRTDTIRIDTVIYDTTWTKIDTVHITDTTWTHIFDTVRVPVTVYDTTIHVTNVTDTVLVPPDTIITRDTIVIIREVEVPVYIIVDPASGTQTIVSDVARATDGVNGVFLEGLTPGGVLVVYNTDGNLVVRATATATGTCLLSNLAPADTYLLWHNGRWTKFAHR